MNKEFMSKMIRAKQLEMEALQEIMPGAMKTCLEELKENVIDIAMEYFKVVQQEKYQTRSGNSGEDFCTYEEKSNSEGNDHKDRNNSQECGDNGSKWEDANLGSEAASHESISRYRKTKSTTINDRNANKTQHSSDNNKEVKPIKKILIG